MRAFTPTHLFNPLHISFYFFRSLRQFVPQMFRDTEIAYEKEKQHSNKIIIQCEHGIENM